MHVRKVEIIAQLTTCCQLNPPKPPVLALFRGVAHLCGWAHEAATGLTSLQIYLEPSSITAAGLKIMISALTQADCTQPVSVLD